MTAEMRAVWYDRHGPASEVLTPGSLPAVQPGPGDVRLRVRVSGVNPGDVKKRQGWLGIPAITAHRALFADGPVHGNTVLVNGAAGAVGDEAAKGGSPGHFDGPVDQLRGGRGDAPRT